MRLQRAFQFSLLLASLATPAAAGEPASDAGSMAKAKTFYYQAKSHEEAGRYVAAAEAYLKAYEVYQDPEFYYNAGAMMDRAGNARLALMYFEKYLTENPNGRVADAARKIVEDLRPKVASEPEPAEGSTEGSSGGEDATEEDQGSTMPPKDEPGPEAQPADDTLQLAGVITAGAGLVSVGLGAYFGLDAASTHSDLETLRDEERFDADLVEQRDSSATLFYVFSGLGVAAIAGGGVMYFLGRGDAEEAAPGDGEVTISIAPSVTDTSAGIWCTGRF